ncbi:MAG: HAD family phosphatase [Planctomycetota bacterium]|nr:MAG: HAD family phosphatase [Planctomycetota bacterium]
MAAPAPTPEPGNWPAPIRAVAFDMDGLMVNTEELYSIVGDVLLRRRGKHFTPELKREMMGLPGPQAYQVMIERSGVDATPDELAAEADAIFHDLLPSRLEPLPGLYAILSRLESREIPCCVATSSSRRFATRVLRGIDVADRFQFLVTAEDVPRGKPYPDIYLAAAQKFGIPPQQMMVLEDSQNGVRAAAEAGALTIAVPGAESRDHDFSAAHCIARSLVDPLVLRYFDSPSRSASSA